MGSLVAVILLLLGAASGEVSPSAELTKEDGGLPTPHVHFTPHELKGVFEGKEHFVSFRVSWSNVTYSFALDRGGELAYRLDVFPENEDVIHLHSNSSLSSLSTCVRPSLDGTNFTLFVRGLFLGYSKVFVTITKSTERECRNLPLFLASRLVSDSSGKLTNGSGVSPNTFRFEFLVSVVRDAQVMVTVVTAIMAVLVAFNFINMGVQIDMECICKVLKKPIGPTIGFFCQFIFMPLAAYFLSHLLLDDVSQRLGLFTLGCSPGGSMSNFWTLLFNGDVNLSVTMTFISTIAALGMMPLWIFTLGSKFFRGNVTIPYLNLVLSLVFLTIPMGIGLLIRQYRPRWAEISRKIIRPATITCVLVAIATGIYTNLYIFRLFTWRVVVAGLSIAWGGYCFGGFVAWVSRLPRQQIIAVSIETAFQNPAVAFVLLTLSLPQPDADLTAVPVIAQLLLTGLPMWVLLICTRLYGLIKKTPDSEKEVVHISAEDKGKEYIPVSTIAEKNVNETNKTS